MSLTGQIMRKGKDKERNRSSVQLLRQQTRPLDEEVSKEVYEKHVELF